MEPRRLFRMPYGFGPSPGPRSGPDGRPFDWTETPARRAVAVSFLSDADALQRLLPPGFTVRGEPVVTVEVQAFTELAWLAGRGYSTLGVKWPATFTGTRDTATGPFLSVLWENLADPILTGRDELGFAKLYAEIHPPRVFGDRETHTATWLGHRFLDLEVSGLADAEPPPAAVAAGPLDGGTLHYKYVPATGDAGAPDAAYACFTPAGGSHQRTHGFRRGNGRVTFHPTRWEDMPTQAHVVEALRALPVRAWRGATVTETRGGKDLSDQRRLA